MLIEKISSLLEEKYKEPEFSDCFTVDVKMSAAKKLEVFVDSDSTMNFRKCQRISRYLEGIIEENNWLGEKYTLEVSSPGLDRPLKFLRQYVKNIGREFNLKLKNGEKKTGKLIAVEEAGIVLEQELQVKEGKKKKTVVEQSAVLLDNIAEAKVKISFKAKVFWKMFFGP